MKKLNLKKEALVELDGDQLRDVAGGTVTNTCGCSFQSCNAVSCICSIGGNCTSSCPRPINIHDPEEMLENLPTRRCVG